MQARSLVSPFAVLGWCAFGVLTGLSADLSFRFLPRSWDARLRAALTGTSMGASSYALTFAALAFFYAGGLETGPGTFAGLTYFGLPWLLASGAFGGYTAWAIAKDLA